MSRTATSPCAVAAAETAVQARMKPLLVTVRKPHSQRTVLLATVPPVQPQLMVVLGWQQECSGLRYRWDLQNRRWQVLEQLLVAEWAHMSCRAIAHQ